MDRANPSNLPIPARTVLKSTNGDILLVEDDIYLYRQIVGSTIYLSNNTRPDIAYAIGQLARFILVPIVTHLQIAKQLLRYLAGTIDVGITYSNRRGELPYSYSIYTNSTWGTEQDRVSFHRYVTIRYRGAVT
jgi:hypothetical protein